MDAYFLHHIDNSKFLASYLNVAFQNYLISPVGINTNNLEIVLIQSASLGAEGSRGGEDSVARTTGSTR